METKYELGATPAHLIQASQLLWANALGCVPLVEDAMLVNPGHQLFHREVDGFCMGDPLKKVQWICTVVLTQLQILLYPNENMQLSDYSTGGPTYAGIEEKLRHLSYIFETLSLGLQERPGCKVWDVRGKGGVARVKGRGGHHSIRRGLVS